MKLKYYIYSFIASLMLIATACSPEEYDLGAKDLTQDDLVEGLAYTITHDAANPNIIYLESKLGSNYTPLWEHPQGRSQASKVTLKMPFEGTYTVKFGVETRGGAVYGEPVTFTVDDFCADFVNNELWTFLTGGVGNSKTWVYDDGNYGYAGGEMDYSDPSQPLGWGIPASGWSPGKGHTGDNNMWDSYMTFDLNGGANVTIHNTYTDGETVASKDESGTFMLDVDNHTITFTDCKIMHTQGWDSKTLNWSSGLTLVALDENHLQVGVMRGGPEVSGEDPWWLVWNFVSKDWADSYVPADKPDPVPDIDGDANEVITTSKSKTWALSVQSPFDWASLDGALMNGFSKPEDYDNGWAAYDANMIAATKFVFTATDAAGGKYTFSSYQNEDIEGTYTIDSNNDIIFDQPLNALISHTDYGWDSNMYLTTSADNKLRIIKTKADVLGNVTDMWLGCRSAEKDEYTAFHFTVGAGVSAPELFAANLNFFDMGWSFIKSANVNISGDGDYTVMVEGANDAPQGMYLDILDILGTYPNMDVAIKDIQVDGKSISFDDTAIERGVGDDPTTARRYILNPWNATAATAPNYVFTSSIAVTITVKLNNGTPFVKE